MRDMSMAFEELEKGRSGADRRREGRARPHSYRRTRHNGRSPTPISYGLKRRNCALRLSSEASSKRVSAMK